MREADGRAAFVPADERDQIRQGERVLEVLSAPGARLIAEDGGIRIEIVPEVSAIGGTGIDRRSATPAPLRLR